jgi:lysyl-tRNA synthetase class 2
MGFENRLSPHEQYVFADTHHIDELVGLELGAPVSISGRVLNRREMKNYTFMDVHDETASVQVISSADTTPEHEGINSVGVGDYIAVDGTLGTSRTGELSVFVGDWALLAKTQHSFPDMRSGGLTDPDTIARQRYLDMATNRSSMERLRIRSKIVSLTRSFMEDQGFMEVETPVLQPIHGGASAKPFETHHNALDMELSLRIAPELYLKRLVVGGLKRVYEIGKVFRNEGISTRHNPEFTMMEAYAAGWDFEGQMKLTEDLVEHLALAVRGSTTIEYLGREVDLSTPWERRTMDSLVSEALGMDISLDTDIATLHSLCRDNGIEYEETFGSGKLILELYEKLTESTLWGPIFVTEHPVEVSPLAREHRTKKGYTERFEGIVAGRELCNAFTELNDPRIQYERFKDQEVAGETDDEAMKMDHDYIRALQYGLPPTAGMGIGIDRLAMLLTDSPSIKDVILFPTLRLDNYISSYETE